MTRRFTNAITKCRPKRRGWIPRMLILTATLSGVAVLFLLFVKG